MAATLTALVARFGRAWSFLYDNIASPVRLSGGGSKNIDESTTQNFGSGAGQANEVYEAILTFVSTTPISLQLVTAGALLNPNGKTVNLAKVKKFFIKNTHATATLTLTGNLLNALGIVTSFVLQPGAQIDVEFNGATAPTVTGSSADTITITPSAGGSADVIITGVAA